METDSSRFQRASRRHKVRDKRFLDIQTAAVVVIRLAYGASHQALPLAIKGPVKALEQGTCCHYISFSQLSDMVRNVNRMKCKKCF